MPMPMEVNGRPVRTGAWTAEEDQLLSDWQKEYGNRWSAVSKKIPGRTGQQCAQRWRHKVNPNIRKEKWTVDEDRLLACLYQEHGCCWAEISRQLHGRTDQQCMGRWRRHLDPAIRRDAWKAREDIELKELHAQYGSQWATIAKFLPGRTAQQCRARWHQMDVDWTNPPSQSSESLSRIATKPRRARSKKHSAYSESDEDDCVISDTEGESDDQEDRPGLQPAQKRVYSIDRLASESSGRLGFDGNSQASDRSTLHQPLLNTGNLGKRQATWQIQESQQHMRSSPSNFGSSAADEEYDEEGRREIDYESPPFIAADDQKSAPTSETQLINRVAYANRSPSCRVMSPGMQQVQGHIERPLATPPKRARSRKPEKQSGKQHSPGTSEQTAWESSPLDVLSLFKSPEPRHKPTDLQSPTFQGLGRGLTPPSTAKTRRRIIADEHPVLETPSKRGPMVRRRLDVESALRTSASERLRQNIGNGMTRGHTIRQPLDSNYESDFLRSPAKKLRSSITRQTQRIEVARGSFDDKESHACDALKQLSMAASFVSEGLRLSQ